MFWRWCHPKDKQKITEDGFCKIVYLYNGVECKEKCAKKFVQGDLLEKMEKKKR
jgi:hypothetical protein